LAIAIIGWAIAAIIAWALVSRVGWLGVAILGAVILFVATRAEPDRDIVEGGVYTTVAVLRGQVEQARARKPEERLARAASKIEQHKVMYVIRSVGIALLLMGAVMFVRRQL